MPNQGPFELKRSPEDESNAILLTFDSRWRTSLVTGQVRVVFRKMGPKAFVPDLMYAYVASPDSAIVARMPITSYAAMPLKDAVQLADQGAISAEELIQYAHTWQELIVMHVGAVAVAKAPITYDYLAKEYNYWPSSTFIPLSRTGKTVLDKLGQFVLADTRATPPKATS
jgi:predicted transcriptional regulator